MTSYVALGDSFAAGVGAGRRRAGPYRTDAGYPVEVARRTGLEVAYQAVLGATSADVVRDQLGPLTRRTRLVTISLGGNDAGFVPVLLECVKPAWMSRSDEVVDEALALARAELPSRLRTVHEAVRTAAPDARVVVTGYPHLFNGVSDCHPLTFVTVAEMRRLAEAADLLHGIVAAAAHEAGAEVVDVRERFAGHLVCDSPEWLNGLSWPLEESYHPNLAGHVAYAGAVLDALELDPLLGPVTEELPVRVRGGRCVGTAPTFRLPDLLSGASLDGAAAHGLDPDQVADLARCVRDTDNPRERRLEAAAELQEMHATVAR